MAAFASGTRVAPRTAMAPAGLRSHLLADAWAGRAVAL